MLRFGWGRSLAGRNIDLVNTYSIGIAIAGHIGIFTGNLPDM